MILDAGADIFKYSYLCRQIRQTIVIIVTQVKLDMIGSEITRRDIVTVSSIVAARIKRSVILPGVETGGEIESGRSSNIARSGNIFSLQRSAACLHKIARTFHVGIVGLKETEKSTFTPFRQGYRLDFKPVGNIDKLTNTSSEQLKARQRDKFFFIFFPCLSCLNYPCQVKSNIAIL